MLNLTWTLVCLCILFFQMTLILLFISYCKNALCHASLILLPFTASACSDTAILNSTQPELWLAWQFRCEHLNLVPEFSLHIYLPCLVTWFWCNHSCRHGSYLSTSLVASLSWGPKGDQMTWVCSLSSWFDIAVSLAFYILSTDMQYNKEKKMPSWNCTIICFYFLNTSWTNVAERTQKLTIRMLCLFCVIVHIVLAKLIRTD